MNFVHQRLRVDEFDRLREVLHGWETEPVQLSPGPLNLTIETVLSSDFSVLRMSLSPRVSDRAVVHAGVVGFVLVERPHLWCGINLMPPAIFITREGRETRSVLEENFSTLEFYFPQEELSKHPFGECLSRKSTDPERSVFPITATAANQLRNVADALLACNSRGSGEFKLQSAAKIRLLDLLEDALRPHFAGAPARLRQFTRRARSDLTIAALEDIDLFGSQDTSLSGLHARLGVTRRALEQAFACNLNVSPGQYLLACRLNEARNQIVTEGRRVVDAATTAGFRDLSRFASQYRRLFGELPSQTLKRCQRPL
jgi:AraC-like DNA-binding protein